MSDSTEPAAARLAKVVVVKDIDPPITAHDRNCALFVRGALFPRKVDWGDGTRGGHHRIHPALDALDRIRDQLVQTIGTPFSTLFPRGVILVPSPMGSVDNPPQRMQWNGQPNIREYNGGTNDDQDDSSSTVEVIPNVLTIKCMECPSHQIHDGVKAYFRMKETGRTNTTVHASTMEQQLIVCSNRVLQKDYYHTHRFDDMQRNDHRGLLLEERTDLPSQSMMVVEEVLAHELSKLTVTASPATSAVGSSSAVLQPPQPATMDCSDYARIEGLAAKLAECMYETEGKEIRMGSSLQPRVGGSFSWLPTSIQKDFQNRCMKEVATQYTSRAYYPSDKVTIKACIDDAWKFNV
jgi:hypothetical protein